VTAAMVGFWSRPLGLAARAALMLLGVMALPLGFVPGAEALHIPSAMAVAAIIAGLTIRGARRAPSGGSSKTV
ncbi:MAG TPA: hypothetical protein PK405_09400, partial [Hyphomicrobiales bacterium]|nr:hypothetical protein [Hyphomicrobiales bacterium]